MWWPTSVYVIDSSFNTTERPGADANNEPQSLLGWMQAELRQNAYLSAYHCNLLIDLWTDAFVWAFQRTRKIRNLDKHTCYNVAWASLGYTEGQSLIVRSLAVEYLAYLALKRPKTTAPKTPPSGLRRRLA